MKWKQDTERTIIHRVITDMGTIEIRDADESVTCGRSGRSWPLFHWRAEGDGVSTTGTARSLGRAKEDSLAALTLLAPRDFETAVPRDEERIPQDGQR